MMKRLFYILMAMFLLPAFVQAADCRVELVNSDKGSFQISYDTPSGAFVKTDQSCTVVSGTTIFIEVKLKDRNYSLDYVSANGNRIESFPYFNVGEDVILEAHFVERTMCNITLLSVKHGKVDIEYIDIFDMGTYAWEEGQQVPSSSMLFIKPTPDKDYDFDCVKYDGVVGKKNYTVTGDVEIEVLFKPNRVFFDYRVENNFDPSKGSVVIKDTEGNIYNTDDMVTETTTLTVTVTPNDDYSIGSFMITGEDFTQAVKDRGSITFVVTKDVLVDTEFTGESSIYNVKKDINYVFENNIFTFISSVNGMLELYDLSGYLKERTMSGKLDLTGYHSGLYLVKITVDNHSTVVKIVKE